MSGLLSRLGAVFVAPATEPPPATPHAPAPQPEASPVRAAVFGAGVAAVHVAAACAGELRARMRAPAALLCVWHPAASELPPQDHGDVASGHDTTSLAALGATAGPAPPGVAAPLAGLGEATGAASPDYAAPPAGPSGRTGSASSGGAATPGARRLAARLAAHGLEAAAVGRLAWLSLPPAPAAAAGVCDRAAALAEVPLVLAVAGPRPSALEAVIADFDLAVAVLPADAGVALRTLAGAGLPTRVRAVLAPLPAGPARWAAAAGLARLRSLPELAP